MPAATNFMPSRTMAWGQHGGGGGAVTGVVAGLGSDFLDHLRAHVLELVLELDFLATETPSLDGGAPNERSSTTLRPFRAQGDLDRVGQDVHALDHAVARVSAETTSLLPCCISVPIVEFWGGKALGRRRHEEGLPRASPSVR